MHNRKGFTSLNSNTLIDIKRIEKYKKNKKNRLNIKIEDLTILRNNKIAILGPPRSGKTSICKIISGLERYSKGSLTKRKNLKINFQTIEQKYSTITSCYDYINLYLNMHNIDLKGEKYQMYLQELDLSNIIHKPMAYLTPDQRQKANVLLSVIFNPDLIILDEITKGISKEAKTKIYSFLKKYYDSNDSSYILVTDNFKDIEEMSETICILYNGRIIDVINTETTINNYKTVEKFTKSEFPEFFILKDKYQEEELKKINQTNNIDAGWLRRWDNENQKRKIRNSKFK